MRFPDRKIVEEIRKQYPVGSRVELIHMDDPQAPPAGTKGTVKGVDDIGSIMVSWDNGCGLSVAYGEDSCKVITETVDETVREQILAIRATGETNMFDSKTVQRMAYERDFYELVCFIEEHPKEYAHFILTGE